MLSRLIQNTVKRLDALEVQGETLAAKNKSSKVLKKVLETLQNDNVKKQGSRESLRAISLKYRVRNIHEHIDKTLEPDPEILKSLTALAIKWKGKQIIFRDSTLSEEQLKRLNELASYPEFAKLLLKNEKETVRFFKWSLVNNLSVQVFVEFPGLAERIDHCHLKGQIGAFKGEGLQYHEVDGKKDVTLLFEGKPVSILDPETKIKFSSGTVLKVREVFSIFQRKKIDESYLTMFKDGIYDWDPNRIAPRGKSKEGLVKVDLTSPDWIKQLPMLKRLSLEEAKELTGLDCDGKSWVLTAVAMRQAKSFNTLGSHSFIRLLIPIGDGSYDLTYGFGKFPDPYVQNSLHSLSYLFQPKKGTLQYPDHNETHTGRDRLEKHFLMTDENGNKCLESIRRGFLRAEKGDLPYQVLSDNCTDWVVKKIRKFIGEEESHLFDIQFNELEPDAPLSALMKVLRRSSLKTSDKILSALSFLMGGRIKMAYQGKSGQKYRCVAEEKPWMRDAFHHPGGLFRKAGR